MSHRLFNHIGWLRELEVQSCFWIHSWQLLHLFTIKLLWVCFLITKGNCKVLGSNRSSLAREVKSFRAHWSIIDHKLAWCTCPIFDLESFWTFTPIVDHKLAWSCWPIIDHELAWCFGPVIDSELVRSSSPIIYFKLVGSSSPVIDYKLIGATCSVIYCKAIRSTGPIIDNKLIWSHWPLIGLELRIAVKWLLEVITLAPHRDKLRLLKVTFGLFLASLIQFVWVWCYW